MALPQDRKRLKETYSRLTTVGPVELDPVIRLVKESLEDSIGLLRHDVKVLEEQVAKLRVEVAVNNTKLVIYGGLAGLLFSLVPMLVTFFKNSGTVK